jgi:anti-sigma B factor antagonist
MPDAEYVVRPEGELDIELVPALRDQWLSAIDEQEPAVFVVDLRDVTFLDSTALGAIVAVRKRQRDHGGDVTVINASPRLVKVFRLTGLDGLLHVHGTGEHVGEMELPNGRTNGKE